MLLMFFIIKHEYIPEEVFVFINSELSFSFKSIAVDDVVDKHVMPLNVLPTRNHSRLEVFVHRMLTLLFFAGMSDSVIVLNDLVHKLVIFVEVKYGIFADNYRLLRLLFINRNSRRFVWEH